MSEQDGNVPKTSPTTTGSAPAGHKGIVQVSVVQGWRWPKFTFRQQLEPSLISAPR
jgi:hypothetical protein